MSLGTPPKVNARDCKLHAHQKLKWRNTSSCQKGEGFGSEIFALQKGGQHWPLTMIEKELIIQKGREALNSIQWMVGSLQKSTSFTRVCWFGFCCFYELHLPRKVSRDHQSLPLNFTLGSWENCQCRKEKWKKTSYRQSEVSHSFLQLPRARGANFLQKHVGQQTCSWI